MSPLNEFFFALHIKYRGGVGAAIKIMLPMRIPTEMEKNNNYKFSKTSISKE